MTLLGTSLCVAVFVRMTADIFDLEWLRWVYYVMNVLTILAALGLLRVWIGQKRSRA